MARPRVFISSTFFDLKQIRADLERFIRELGYEPVLNERGSIPYGSQEKLEEYCYKEIELADIVITIIGGRYGSDSLYQPYSISQIELKTALSLGKQVYIFVERSVLHEYSTYKNNKDIEGIRYQHADNIAVYKFLEEIESLPRNNSTAPFETSQDITDYLKEQWAGLFQRFLQEQGRLKDFRIIENIQATAKTLNHLVTFLTEERRNKDQAIQDILLSNHPVFEQIRSLTDTKYRIFFTNHDEMSVWFEAQEYYLLNEDSQDHPGYEEWITFAHEVETRLLILKDLFDDSGRLKIYTAGEWDENWILLEKYETVDINDVPF